MAQNEIVEVSATSNDRKTNRLNFDPGSLLVQVLKLVHLYILHLW